MSDTILYPYYFDHQIEKFIGQAMKAFSGFIVKDGVERDGSIKEKRVMVTYGPMDRVVSNILSTDDKFKNHRIPIMAVNVSSMTISPEKRLSSNHKRDIPYRTSQGEQKIRRKITGNPISLNIELGIYASSITQLFEIIEQILLVFNPGVTLQKSNNVFDDSYRAHLRLESVEQDISFPFGSDKKTVHSNINFTMPIRIAYPDVDPENLINTIIQKTKVGDISEETIVEDVEEES